MSETPAANFEEIPLGDGLCLELPPRRIAVLRTIGAGLLGIALCGLGFGFFAGTKFADQQQLLDPAARAPSWMPLAISLFSVLSTAPFLVLGLHLLLGRTDLEVDGAEIRSIARAGPLRWTRRVPLLAARRLSVGPRGAAGPSPRGSPSLLALHVATASGPKVLAWGHSAERLHAVAVRLADEANRRRRERAAAEGRAEPEPLRVAEAPEGDGDDGAVSSFESADRVAVEQGAATLRIVVAPAGFGRIPKGMLPMSVLWLGITTVVAFGFGVSIAIHPDSFSVGQRIGLCAFFLVFFGIGFLLLRTTLRMARQSAVIEVTGTGSQRRLRLERSWCRARVLEWPADSLEVPRVDPSGVEIGGKKLYELRLGPRGGRKRGVLSQLPRSELERIAASLAAALAESRGSPLG